MLASSSLRLVLLTRKSRAPAARTHPHPPQILRQHLRKPATRTSASSLISEQPLSTLVHRKENSNAGDKRQLCAPSGDSVVIDSLVAKCASVTYSYFLAPVRGFGPWSRQHCQDAKELRSALFPEESERIQVPCGAERCSECVKAVRRADRLVGCGASQKQEPI
jgi:hypothetical protein